MLTASPSWEKELLEPSWSALINWSQLDSAWACGHTCRFLESFNDPLHKEEKILPWLKHMGYGLSLTNMKDYDFQSKRTNPAGWVSREREFPKVGARGVAANLRTRDPPAFRCSKEKNAFSSLSNEIYLKHYTGVNFLCVVSLFCLFLSVLLSPAVGLISILIIKLFLH